MEFLAFTPQDVENIRHLQPEGWEDIRINFKQYLGFVFCEPVKAVENNSICGIGVAVHFGTTAWLAHIIVDPESRNRGIGQKIVGHLVDRVTKRGAKTVFLIATELGVPVYEKFGFKEQTRYLFFNNNDRSEKITQYSPHIRPIKPGDKTNILKIDRRIFNEDRSPLLSPFLDTGFVHQKDKDISGFYLSDLGQGLVEALDDTSGLALMQKRIRKQNRVVVPKENAACIRFLTDNGFKQVLTAKRMILGDPLPFYAKGLFSRIGGNFG